MSLLDADHPDIESFIGAKAKAERMAHLLRDAGYSTSIKEVGSTHDIVPFQSTNFTVRLPDRFMEAARDNEAWDLRYRHQNGGGVTKTVKARELFHAIAEGIWECGDPGVMFTDTVDDWSTFRTIGPITTSNPCQPDYAPVLTPEGIRTFADIDVGSIIWSGHSWTKVVRKEQSGTKPVYAYRTLGGTFIGTEQHTVICQGRKVAADQADFIDHAAMPEDMVDPWDMPPGVACAVIDREGRGNQPVWNITVEDPSHTYWAGGLLVANCGEVLHFSNMSCNLAAVNLLPPDRGPLSVPELERCARVLMIAQDAICSLASYPTSKIERQTKAYRPIGIGVANLGALFMSEALPYDSDAARGLASDIMHTLTTASYEASFDLSQRLGSFQGADRCGDNITHVFHKHRDHARTKYGWDRLITRVVQGELPRHTFTTCCMPTGTVSLLMDCDTTGIEPYFALDTKKTMAFGGELRLTARYLGNALTKLGYSPEEVEAAIKSDLETVSAEHLPVFDSAQPRAGRYLSPRAHVDMLAAIQGGIGSGISKTVNMPREATVEDIENLLTYAWEQDIKCLSIYRDGSKVAQPLTTATTTEATASVTATLAWGERKKLPHRCRAERQKFELSGAEFYMHVGLYPDGTPGEVFLRQGKEGSTMAGLVDAWSIAVSFALQHGAPLKDLMEKFVGLRWPPDGWVDGHYYSSPADYVAKWMLENYGDKPAPSPAPDVVVTDTASPTWAMNTEIHLCSSCGNRLVQSGRCLLCPSCGSGVGGCTG
jgi:ribonucleotide reductase alpha subunit